MQGGITSKLLLQLKIPINVDYEAVLANKPDSKSRFRTLDRKYLRPFFTRFVYQPPEDNANMLELHELETASLTANNETVDHNSDNAPLTEQQQLH